MEKYKIKEIRSERFENNWASWHVAYEWEDGIANLFNIDVLPHKKRSFKWILRKRKRFNKICKLYNSLAKLLNIKPKKELTYYIQTALIGGQDFFYPWEMRSKIPYIIDAFFDEKDLDEIYAKYAQCPLVIFSSLEVYSLLKEKNCPLNIAFIPFCIGDQYKLNPERKYEKKYDIVSAGRESSILCEYTERYIKENPHIEYVYRKEIRGNDFIYYSNKTGEIGAVNTREEYMDLVKKSRISLYSTPGIPGVDCERTRGFNPVTMRYIEQIACQCQIAARYADNVETRYFRLDQVSPHIETYEEFKNTLDTYLITEPDLNLYSSILDSHYCSDNAKRLEKELELLNN